MLIVPGFLLLVLNIVSLVISFYFCYKETVYHRRLHVKKNGNLFDKSLNVDFITCISLNI